MQLVVANALLVHMLQLVNLHVQLALLVPFHLLQVNLPVLEHTLVVLVRKQQQVHLHLQMVVLIVMQELIKILLLIF